MMIYDNYTVIPFVSGLHRTDLSTRGVIAVIAKEEHGLLVGIGAVLFLEPDFSNPVYIPSCIPEISHVILMPACVQASGATGATFIEIDYHSPSATG
jgi:hypothetical protein